MSNFIEDYLQFTWETEPPRVFHRWSAIMAVSALLGRNYYCNHGMFRIFPNLFTMFIGDAGTRKSTAIKIMKKHLAASGYDTFAADKTRLEKFLLDLEGEQVEETVGAGKKNYDAVLATNLWGDEATNEPRECFICADEWNDFAPRGDIDFCTLLGNFWDWDNEKRPYTHRLKNSKSVSIYQPTLTILGGNTPDGLAKAFPPEMIGTGFLSRTLFIYGERSGRKYTFPPIPSDEAVEKVISQLADIRATCMGKVSFTEGAVKILDHIYREWEDLDDVRFKSYSNRRFTQLLKLCLVCAAAQKAKEISEEIIIRGNTYLSSIESTMPRALGEFGKGRNSDVANKIMDLLATTGKPLTVKDIWAHVHNDLDKINLLADIMNGLSIAEKIQHIPQKGFLPKKIRKAIPDYVDFGLLTDEERRSS